jgi:serine protease Do
MNRWSLALVCLILGVLAGSYVLAPVLHGQGGAPGPVIPRELTSYRDVVKKVLPAVVSLEIKAVSKPKAKAVQGKPPSPFDPGEAPLGFGSGFIVDPKGVVLTSYHAVSGATLVQIELPDGRKFLSKDIRGDRKTDLAIIRFPIGDKEVLPHLELGDSEAMEIGDRVLAFGAPFGLTGSVTSGIVSAKGRTGLKMNMYEDFIQTDAAINPGNSGGPLVNLEGKVIGINAAIKSRGGGFQGVGLAVASNLARHVIKALETDGVVRRGYLGLEVTELPPDVAARLGLEKGSGVLVREVYDGTPAARAGLQTGDVITTIAGQAIKDSRILQAVVVALPLNKPADVAVVRDGKAQVIPVLIEEQPESFGTVRVPQSKQDAVAVGKLGFDLADLTEALAAELGYRRDTAGVAIVRVAPNSPATLAGLERGMLLLKVDNLPVASAAAARTALERGSLERGILLQVRSLRGGTSYVLLQANEF